MQQVKSSIPSFEEIRHLWDEIGEAVYSVRLVENESGIPDENTIRFLVDVGFPESSEPGLDFTDLTEKLFTHSQLYTRDDFPALDQYLVIGSTGEGNPVCIDTKDSSIVYIDHDNGFESVFINRNLVLFSYFLVNYGKTIKSKATLTITDMKGMEERMYSADPQALAEQTFWTDELTKLERELS